jgi:1-phosphofructokinase family hexose kinase
LILVAGLSPVWQQVLLLDALAVGEVNRAREAHWCASGKVLNAARALHHLGAPGKALTVVGGLPGEEVRRDCARLGVASRWVEVATPSRVCTTVVEAARRTATELVPEAGAVSDGERAAFVDAYAEEAAAAAVVILIGSLPAGTPAGLYRELLARTPGKAIVDARGPELLEALNEKPFLVKPNREELQRTLGRALLGDAELFDAMREMSERGAEWVVITDGGNPVHVRGHGRLYRLGTPRVSVVNPIGCGDCLAAGIAWAVYRGLEAVEAVRYGLAVAVDKLGRLLPGLVDQGGVDALVGCVEVTPL